MPRQRTLLYSHSCAPDAQTQTMPSKPEVEQYIKDNALEAALAAAVSATVKARPLDAMAYLSQELAKATKPVAPCFYTVYHEFVPGKAAAWWEQIMKQTPEENRALHQKFNKLGFHNHSFMPAGVDGPINCLWESMWTRIGPGPPCRTYGQRIPPSCVLYVPGTPGSLPPDPHCTYAVRAPASGVPFVPFHRGTQVGVQGRHGAGGVPGVHRRPRWAGPGRAHQQVLQGHARRHPPPLALQGQVPLPRQGAVGGLDVLGLPRFQAGVRGEP